jgi:raffinose/stachyose/melibiose transport system substrate-binding protein
VNRGEKMKTRLFKRTGAILLTAALTLSISACSTNTPANTSSTSSTKAAKVTLTLSTYNDWWTADTLKTAIYMYESQTGNKISAQVYSQTQFISVMQTKMATGDVSDIVAINNASPFTASELTPLTGAWTSKLDKTKLYANGYGFDNKTVYAAPFGADAFQGLIYNKKIFAQAGITLPLATYTDFVNACKAIKALPGNIVPLSVPNGDPWPAQIAMYAGSMYIPMEEPNFNADMISNKLKPQDDKGLVDMINRVMALKTDGYMNSDMQSLTMPKAEVALATGKTAMLFGGNWCYGEILTSNPDKLADLSMTAVNWGDKAADLSAMQTGSGYCLLIPSASTQKTASQDFVNFVVSPAVIKAMFALSPGITDLGYSTTANPWDADMNSLITSGKAKIADMFVNAVKNSNPSIAWNWADVALLGRSIFSGESPVKALNEWYIAYSEQNKAKGIPGF